MALRLLVAEGNTQEGRMMQASRRGATPSQAYALVLKALEPEAQVDICYPADAGTTLRDGVTFHDYDGVFITGSALNIYADGPEITRQLAFVRQAFQHETPIFGSCWGLQLLTVAAGGAVRRNPKGIEFGFARAITPTSAGKDHALLHGRTPAFDAPSVHFDEVSVLADGMSVLASNPMSDVQAAELRQGPCVAWAVQYHPEFSLHELADIALMLEAALVAEGRFASPAAVRQWHDDMIELEAKAGGDHLASQYRLDEQVLALPHRRREIRNFIAHLVRPVQAARGRG